MKYARSLHRQRVRNRERVMLVEGVRAIREALLAGGNFRVVLYRSDLPPESDAARLVSYLTSNGVRVHSVAPNVFERVPDTATPQGIVAITEFPDVSTETDRGDQQLVLVLDRVRDPGNLGTLIRSAQGAGVHQVLVAPESADPFSPKVIRAGMGSHFRVPIKRADWDEIARSVEGCVVAAAAANAGTRYDDFDWTVASALIVGNETQGLSDHAMRLTSVQVGIPLAKELDSLNAAVAGSIILFEAARQRRKE